MAIQRELALDTDPASEHFGDLLLDGGRLVLLSGSEAVAQRVRVRLLTFLGEWRFDVNRGTPWLEQILGRAPDLSLITSILRQRIAETDGVSEVLSLSLDVDRANGGLSVSGRIRADSGESADVALEVA